VTPERTRPIWQSLDPVQAGMRQQDVGVGWAGPLALIEPAAVPDSRRAHYRTRDDAWAS